MSLLKLTMHLHVMLGVTGFGLMIASFYYVCRSMNQELSLFRYALMTSFFSDTIILPIIIYEFFSGYLLMQAKQLSIATPPILANIISLGLILFLWLGSLLIRYVNFKKIQENNDDTSCLFKKHFIIINLSIILLYMLIIHDAVMHQTLFNSAISG